MNILKKRAVGSDQKYEKSFKGRVRRTKRYHKEEIAPLTELDTLTGEQLEKIWKMQGGRCACCGIAFNSLDDAELSHISGKWFFNRINIQLLHENCNKMQRDLTLPFMFIVQQYGKTFLELFLEYRDWTIEAFFLKSDDVRRIDSRIKAIEAGRV